MSEANQPFKRMGSEAALEDMVGVQGCPLTEAVGFSLAVNCMVVLNNR